jgi:hypothetical protein
MFSPSEVLPARWFSRFLVLLALICSFSLSASEEPWPAQSEAWLVTYGPGEIYWQRFGHNAIWIRDAQLGLDHVFNFGFFDFEQEDFLLRFVQGRMLYFSAARPAQEEFTAYINENRSIRAQRLDLSREQILGLTDYLLEEIRPENRDYLYDYYLNNCSTRVRDAIDMAMGGLLRAEFQPQPAPQTWRDHTRRLTHEDFWLYLGLEVGLGAPVDREISRWDEMFIPAMLADGLASLEYSGDASVRPLVLEDVQLFESTVPQPPREPRAWWPGYLLFALGLVFAAGLLSQFGPVGTAAFLARSWLVLSGLTGLALLFLWVGTDHSVARSNMNLLVFFPAWIILAFWKNHERLMIWSIAGFSVLAVILSLLPFHQYNADVLAAFVPLNLAAAIGLMRRKSRGQSPSAERTGQRDSF